MVISGKNKFIATNFSPTFNLVNYKIYAFTRSTPSRLRIVRIHSFIVSQVADAARREYGR